VKNIFENKIFNEKINNVKTSIENYLNEKKYSLNNLTIDDIIHWNDLGKKKIIIPSEKCPEDIKNIVTNFIKSEFPNPNEK
jgi:hypothetical protein